MKKFLTIQMDADNLSPAQQRLIRYMNSMLLSALTCDDEDEYFECSNEAMRMFAGLIRKANFNNLPSAKSVDIPYDKQVLEFCLESLDEDLSQDRSLVFDN